MCSLSSGHCLEPFVWPEKFDSAYECSIAGYDAAAAKLKEIGKEGVNKYKVSITFMCTESFET